MPTDPCFLTCRPAPSAPGCHAAVPEMPCTQLSTSQVRAKPVPPAAESRIRLPVPGLRSGEPGEVGVGTVPSPFIWTTVPMVRRVDQSPPMLLTVSLPPSTDPGGPRASPLLTTTAGRCSSKSPAPTIPNVPAAHTPHPKQSPLMWPLGQVQSCLPQISCFRREDFLSGLDWW